MLNLLLNCFQICYGLTETSPITNQTLVDDPVDLRVSTVGRVHPNNEVLRITSCMCREKNIQKNDGVLFNFGSQRTRQFCNDSEKILKISSLNREKTSGNMVISLRSQVRELTSLVPLPSIVASLGLEPKWRLFWRDFPQFKKSQKIIIFSGKSALERVSSTFKVVLLLW